MLCVNAEYRSLNKEIKRSKRKDKRGRFDVLANKAQLAADTRQLKDLYQITNTLSNRRKSQLTHIRDKPGNLIAAEIDQL